jgi:hypothetical protein
MRRGLRAFVGTLAAATAAAIVAAPAQAEYADTTAQAVRAHAEWLAWAPAPAGGPVAVCLVDTGVDANPDTSSSVAVASPLDADSAPGDGGATKHGTLMASIMAAPHNGWGMVGAWPQLKIIDVRAVSPGVNSFTYNNYQRAIQRCLIATPSSLPLKAINLSIGGDASAVTETERDTLIEAVDDAKVAGVNVVAAAGNEGGPVEAPGEYTGIFTVAAGDNGALCSIASRGPEVDLAAPGCGLDQVFPDGSPAIQASGSSQATAFTSAVIAALRAYKPSLTVAQAEAVLTATADPTSDGYKQLNVEAAFRAEGLDQVIADAQAARAAALAPPAAPAGGGGGAAGGGGGAAGGGGGAAGATKIPADDPVVPQAPVSPPPAATPTLPAGDQPAVVDRMTTPKASRLRKTSRGYALTLRNRPSDALAIVTVYSSRGAKTAAAREFGRIVKRMQGIKSRFVIRVSSWDRVEVVYRDGLAADSLALTVKAPKSSSQKATHHTKSKKAKTKKRRRSTAR